MPLSDGQVAALRELRRIDATGDAIELVSIIEPDEPDDLIVIVSIDSRFPSADGGITLRPREEVVVLVPLSFPWSTPSAFVRHRRWAGTNHVNWGYHLCLYLAPDVEWNPSDGMHGFLHRLLEFLRRAAVDDLDPVAAPLHPPAVLASADAPTAVIWGDTPAVSDTPWLGFAPLENRTERLIELRNWIDRDDDQWAYIDADVAPAFLSHRKLYYDFPQRLGPLLAELEERGVPKTEFLLLLRVAALRNSRDAPLYVIIGSPTRGLRNVDERQHLAIWQIDPDDANKLRLTVPRDGDTEELSEIRSELLGLMENWAEHTKVSWCRIDEARPEVTNRRDADSPLAALHDKRVTILGCGAIGSHLAEHLIRAGVRQLNLVDNRRVTTGNLIRQNYTHHDLATPKAAALRDRLARIRPDLTDNLSATDADVHSLIADPSGPIWACDVLVDATANASIAKRLDQALASTQNRPWRISLLLGHAGDIGLMTTLTPDSNIGGVGAFIQAKLSYLAQPDLAQFANEFWPVSPRTELFVPEPGCSSPTFTGANADVAALVGTLVRESAISIERATSSATVGALGDAETAPHAHRIDLKEPVVLRDSISSYRVLITASAHGEIQAWICKAARTAAGAETGGLLFGEIDNATHTVTVTAAIGPPPDSRASPRGFVCGTAGTAQAAARLDDRSRGTHRPIGMWHTHPDGNPNASPTDLAGMTFLTSQTQQPLPQQLLLIAGGDPLGTAWNTYLFDRETKQWPRPTVQRPATPLTPPRRIGLALSGGGLRAAAYHLGCLRSLHDRGLLDEVSVISGVSGGSIVAALWAYSSGPFDEFDLRVTDLLRRGLTRRIAAKALRPSRLARTLAATATAGVASLPNAVLGPGGPLRRWSSNTAALEDSLTDLIGDIAMADVARPNLDVVINACELRTGSAFRFGSKESGTWRHGLIKDNDVRIAQAVACSAAYPVVFAAADLRATFVGQHGEETEQRVILTDGGVFDNLGTSCLMPNRSPRFSTNVHEVDIVIACDAGRGLFDGKPRPYWFAGRMKRTLEATYRRAQSLERGRLFDDARSTDGLERFVVAMLGMTDDKLPVPVADLVPRDNVTEIKTSFNRLSGQAIDDVSKRGEQIMWALCGEYL